MNETATSPGITYTYDNAGNMICETKHRHDDHDTYTYDYRQSLDRGDARRTVIATYTYDALNRRIGIEDNGTQTWTVYDGTESLRRFQRLGHAAGAVSLRPGRRERGGRGRDPGADQLRRHDGLVLARQAGLGARHRRARRGRELDHVVYDSFGNIVTETNAANGDRFKFAGMEYDAGIGQYYDRAREYNSSLGRFNSLDPEGFAPTTMIFTDTSGMTRQPLSTRRGWIQLLNKSPSGKRPWTKRGRRWVRHSVRLEHCPE